jgi:hypothetical protein
MEGEQEPPPLQGHSVSKMVSAGIMRGVRRERLETRTKERAARLPRRQASRGVPAPRVSPQVRARYCANTDGATMQRDDAQDLYSFSGCQP